MASGEDKEPSRGNGNGTDSAEEAGAGRWLHRGSRSRDITGPQEVKGCILSSGANPVDELDKDEKNLESVSRN